MKSLVFTVSRKGKFEHKSVTVYFTLSWNGSGCSEAWTVGGNEGAKRTAESFCNNLDGRSW